MLYTGGVAFFALLAVFPAIALLMGFYKIVLSNGQASDQVAALTSLVPHAAQGMFSGELERLASASARAVSAQSAAALVIGAYAAHRGFKALLAGLNLIHDEQEPHGFLKFNLLAFFVALFAFALFTVVSGAVVTSRLVAHAEDGGGGTSGLWPTLGLWFGLTALYRYAMSHQVRVAWAPAIVGGAVATILSALSSWLCAVYVDQMPTLGATYGSVGAVVVLLIWLSWNINAVFYGGAFATEMEIVWRTRHTEDAQSVPEPEAAADVVSLQARRASRRGS